MQLFILALIIVTKITYSIDDFRHERKSILSVFVRLASYPVHVSRSLYWFWQTDPNTGNVLFVLFLCYCILAVVIFIC